MPPERTYGTMTDAFFPYEEIGDNEIDQGGHFEGNGGCNPETAPIISLEHELAKRPVKPQVHNGSGATGEHEHNELREKFFTGSVGHTRLQVRKVTNFCISRKIALNSHIH